MRQDTLLAEQDPSALAEIGGRLGLTQLAETVHRVLRFPLFEVSGTEISVATVLLVGVIVIVAWWMSHVLQRAVLRTFRSRGVTDVGTTQVTTRLLHYAIMAIGLMVALDTIGIPIGALFAAGAIFAIGLGFAMQNIAQNFVSGVILLVERAIRPGDVVEVEGRVVRVLRMGIRTTVARTRDDEELIIPNAALVQSAVKNFTLEDPVYRLRVQVGVHYRSDMKAVRAALLRAADTLLWRLPERDPVVLLRDFGDSSVDWEVSVWCDDAWGGPRMQSELREAVWWALEEDDIEISYPQMDVHFDPPVEEGFSRLRPAG
jgi:small-conductance mechanosensitive channel